MYLGAFLLLRVSTDLRSRPNLRFDADERVSGYKPRSTPRPFLYSNLPVYLAPSTFLPLLATAPRPHVRFFRRSSPPKTYSSVIVMLCGLTL